jgi:acyl-CoA synthetase (AMP-forming)/AMP-acid ligase II
MFLVPSMIRMMLDEMPVDWQVPASFRWLYYAGSPIQSDTQDQATRAFGGRLVQSFAQMESPMFFTVLDGAGHVRCVDDELLTVRSAGRVLPGVELTIVDEAGRAVPTGTDGEITAQAPQTMIGYWHRPEETAKALVDGWLHTGDVGHLDEAGNLYVVDRLKDMIVTGG